MDYRKFIEYLPTLYDNWGGDFIQPKSDVFARALQVVGGMTTPNVMQLLNFAVGCMDPDEVYCEVGCFRGSTLVGALLNNPGRMAYAVDNFSEFDPDGENKRILEQNLSSVQLLEQVCFCDQGFDEFFYELRQIQSGDRVGVYFYDGAHDYRSQLMGLLMVRPFLADQAIIVVDDSNCSAVKQADWDFITAQPECFMVFDLATPHNAHPTFWNGIHVLGWDVNRTDPYSWETLQQNGDSGLLKAMYDFSHEFEQQKQLR